MANRPKQSQPSSTIRHWPLEVDLLAWHLFHMLDSVEHPTPPDIRTWIDEFRNRSPVETHKMLWAEGIEEYQNEFMSPENT